MGKNRRHGGQNSSDHGAQDRLGKAGHTREHANRVAHAAPGDRGRVGHQTEGGRLERFKAEPDQERTGDGDRRPTAASSFQKGPEAEGDQDQLQSLVGRQGRDRVFHDLELSGLDGDVVEENRADNDPGDANQAKDNAQCSRRHNHRRRHPENDHGQQDGHQQARQRRDPDAHRSAISVKKSVMTGRAATRVERVQDCKGS